MEKRQTKILIIQHLSNQIKGGPKQICSLNNSASDIQFAKFDITHIHKLVEYVKFVGSQGTG